MNKLFYKRKAVATSLFICTILILISTFGPIMNGKHIQGFLDDNKEITNIESQSSYNFNTYEDIVIFIKNLLKETKNIALLRWFDGLDYNLRSFGSKEVLDDYTNIFNKVMEYFISQNLNRRELISVVYQEIIPIHKEIKNIITKEKPDFDISSKFQNFLADINLNYEDEDKDETQINYPDPYGYWNDYQYVLDHHFLILNTNNFADWHSQVIWFITGPIGPGFHPGILLDVNIGMIIIALVIGLLTNDFIISFVLATAAAAADLLVFGYGLDGYIYYNNLRSLEVSPIIHIVDKSGQGINGLNGVFTSNDAKEWPIGGIYDLTVEDDFTYDLINVNNTDELGWYKVKVRSDELGRYYQPPPPPGSSNIKFFAQETGDSLMYEELSKDILDIAPGETYLETFIIESNPNIPDAPIGPNCLQLNKEYTYIVVSKDPDGGQLKYQLDFDADGMHEYSDYNDYTDSEVPVQISHIWDSPGTYVIKVRTLDDQQQESGWSKGLTVVVSP